MSPLLHIDNLQTVFETIQGSALAVDHVSLDLHAGETLAVVGESGCGKTVLALSILGLVPSPPGRIAGGSIQYGGQELTGLNEREMRDIRGNAISMIFQEPMTSLNPVFRIERQIVEALQEHRKLSKKEARDEAINLLSQVGIPLPERRLRAFPHELSGGMRQRVMIAMALACNPDILIADEPTTALDVTIQAEILDLMRHLRDENDSAIVLITHDLGVVAESADKVAVMYAGEIVEQGGVVPFFKDPLHPYSQGLINSVPSIAGDKKIVPIHGLVPNLFALPTGCRFHPRCPHVMEICRTDAPPLFEREGRPVRCWLYR